MKILSILFSISGFLSGSAYLKYLVFCDECMLAQRNQYFMLELLFALIILVIFAIRMMKARREDGPDSDSYVPLGTITLIFFYIMYMAAVSFAGYLTLSVKNGSYLDPYAAIILASLFPFAGLIFLARFSKAPVMSWMGVALSLIMLIISLSSTGDAFKGPNFIYSIDRQGNITCTNPSPTDPMSVICNYKTLGELCIFQKGNENFKFMCPDSLPF